MLSVRCMGAHIRQQKEEDRSKKMCLPTRCTTDQRTWPCRQPTRLLRQAVGAVPKRQRRRFQGGAQAEHVVASIAAGVVAQQHLLAVGLPWKEK